MTFRARLVLLNAAGLVGLLGAFAGALSWVNQSHLREDLLRDLRGRGEDAARAPRPPSAPKPPFPQAERRGPDPYAEARRLADVRRPRFFDANGGGDTPLDPASLAGALKGKRAMGEAPGLLTFSLPLRGGGAVQVARETGDLDRLASAQGRALLMLLPVGALTAALGAWLLARGALRPVRRIALAADALGASDLASRLPVEGDDELAGLARTLNAMLARLHRSFEEQRRFVADASHELRTPLARLRLAASASRTRYPKDDDIASIDRAAGALSELTQSLLVLAKADATGLGLRLQPVDLRVVVAEALDDAAVEADFPQAPVPVLADAPHLGRAVRNLLENARRHSPPPGRIFITVTLDAQIIVRDEGEGIASEHLPHVFERFYRADSSRHGGGTGLGLALVREIARAHGGDVDIQSEEGTGTTVRLKLRRIDPS